MPTASVRLSPPPATVPFAPMPLQVTVVRHERGGEVTRDMHLVWEESEARRCARCPLAECVRRRIPGHGLSTCVVVRKGEASARFAVSVGAEDP